MTPIGEMYIARQREMDARYQNAIVLVEIGKFYEAYGFAEEEGREEIGRAREVSRVTNIILTRKNKNLPISMSNPYMCGFPGHSLARYTRVLVENGFTVAIFDQDGTSTSNSNGNMTRKLRGIYSPGVMMEEEEAMVPEENEKNVDAAVLAVYGRDGMEGDIVLDLCLVSTSDGRILLQEEAVKEQEGAAFLQRALDMYRPKEILWGHAMSSDVVVEMLKEALEKERVVIHKIPLLEKEDKKYLDAGYQEKVLSKIFEKKKESAEWMSMIEQLDLERHPDLVSILVFLLCFLQDHHPLAVFRLHRPIMEHGSDRVFYNPWSLYELNLISTSSLENPSMLDLLDATVTPGGKKLLRYSFFTPLHDIVSLQRKYDEIDACVPLVRSGLNLGKEIEYCNLPIDHYMRRLLVGSISVTGMYRLVRFLLDVHALLPRFASLPIYEEMNGYHKMFQLLEDWVRSRWDLHFMQSWRSWEDGIWRVTPPDLLEKETEWMRRESEIKDWISSELGEDLLSKLTMTDEECFLQVTKKRSMAFVGKSHLRMKTMSSTVRIYHEKLDRYFIEYRRLRSFLCKKRKALFVEELSVLVEQHEEVLAFYVRLAARLDVMMCHAQNVVRYSLHRPLPIVPSSPSSTMLDCKQLRHLIVEQSNPSSRYVPNDVCLSDTRPGMLLFGQNSAGKCFARGTPMILWDGTIRNVEDLVVGDMLVGDNGTRRRILCQTRGSGQLYDVLRGDRLEILMTVNADHILCLWDKKRQKILEVTVREIMDKPSCYRDMMYQVVGEFDPRKFQMEEEIMAGFEDKKMIRLSEMDMDIVRFRRIHRILLHRGRRVVYKKDCLVVEPMSNNILPVAIRKRKDWKEEEYFGMMLDGNQRFLLPDGTVAHNSTLMKSVAVATMMAQCGMFVPCESMTWTPVRSLFTKIGSRDNIWKGKSTFITEMSELKHILHRASSSSLVVCDELTSGTETFSATGIVAGTLLRLLEVGCPFIMTTHLHTLKHFPELMTNERLRITHLAMEYNAALGKLCFDRILREGHGKSIYGLEIAEYLGFPADFLKTAYGFRSRLETIAVPSSAAIEPATPVPNKRSRYNKKKIVDRCERCHSTKNLHTHHIEHQATADSDGKIGTYHKNVLHNLMILCEECHDREHHHIC